MPWNEPGNDKKGPWDPKKKSDGPPDLDDLLKSFWKKIGGSGGGNSTRGSGNGGGIGLSSILILALIVWVALGTYTVKEQENAVILRFGAYNRTVEAGIHWLPKGIEKKLIVDIQKLRKIDIHAEMLTRGANIVFVDLGIQYLVIDPQDYLFNLTDPDGTVRDVAETALRQIIGDSTLDDTIAQGKTLIRTRTMEIMRRILDDKYHAGIRITNVTVGDAKPPQAVKEAFDDVISAQADRKKYEKEAEAFANREIPKAEGNAQKIIEAALAYKEKVVADAQGKVAVFNKLLPQYEAAPKVTRRRLYLETMEQVMGKMNKIIVDKKSNQLNVMSLDALLSAQKKAVSGGNK